MTPARATAVLSCLAVAACSAPEGRSDRPAGYRWPSRLTVTFEDRLGPSFDLVLIDASLDGETLYRCEAGEQVVDSSTPLVLHDGPVAAGPLELEVALQYRGNGQGVFSYLRQYRFAVRARHGIEAPPDGAAAVHVLAEERGGPTTPLEDRPGLRFLPDGPATPATARGCPLLPGS
jgi:hypothetical protein